MVKIRVPNPIKMDDLGGPLLFLGHCSCDHSRGVLDPVVSLKVSQLRSFVDVVETGGSESRWWNKPKQGADCRE